MNRLTLWERVLGIRIEQPALSEREQCIRRLEMAGRNQWQYYHTFETLLEGRHGIYIHWRGGTGFSVDTVHDAHGDMIGNTDDLDEAIWLLHKAEVDADRRESERAAENARMNREQHERFHSNLENTLAQARRAK